MRKKLVASIIIVLIMILCSITIVNASTGNANLTTSSTSVKPGETFIVTLSVNCEDGINGVDTAYSYDQDKLELVSANEASNNWANLGIDDKIQVICNSTSKLTSEDIYVLTFKVKDNASIGTTAKVNISEIKVNSDVSESNFTEEPKSVTINIISEDSNIQDGNNTENQDSNITNNNNDESQNSNVVDNNEQNQNSNVINNNNEENKSSNAINKTGSTYTNKDSSAAKSILPKTGDINYNWIIAILGISVIVALYSLIRIKIINKEKNSN